MTNYEESILTIIFFVFVVFIFLAQKGLLDKGLGLQDQKLWIHQGNNKTKLPVQVLPKKRKNNSKLQKIYIRSNL